MDVDVKIWLGILSIVLAAIGFVPYLRGIWRGETRPHLFSWIIWSLVTVIVFLAQLSDGAGPGAWVTGFVLIPNLIVVFFAFKQKNTYITRADWVLFLLALAAIPLWLATENALYAVILLTGIMSFGYLSTLRKGWVYPHEEVAFFYILAVVRHAVTLSAIVHYSLITTLYPAATFVLTLVMVAILLFRRWRMI